MTICRRMTRVAQRRAALNAESGEAGLEEEMEDDIIDGKGSEEESDKYMEGVGDNPLRL